MPHQRAQTAARLRAIASRRRAGFTIVELVLTAVIVGLIAAIAVPRYAASMSTYRVDAAARRVVADLEFAQGHAVARSKAVTATFDPAAESMILTGIADADHPGQDYVTRFDADPYGADLVTANFGGGPTLVYTGFGRPSAGGTVVVAVGANTRTITVDPDTGEATLP